MDESRRVRADKDCAYIASGVAPMCSLPYQRAAERRLDGSQWRTDFFADLSQSLPLAPRINRTRDDIEVKTPHNLKEEIAVGISFGDYHANPRDLFCRVSLFWYAERRS